jgi:hypothetical protein
MFAPVGDAWEAVIVATGGLLVGRAAGKRLFRWSRRRCDEALTAARRLAPADHRRCISMAQTDDHALSRAHARQLRAIQQALDEEGWGGALLARRAAPAPCPAVCSEETGAE